MGQYKYKAFKGLIRPVRAAPVKAFTMSSRGLLKAYSFGEPPLEWNREAPAAVAATEEDEVTVTGAGKMES